MIRPLLAVLAGRHWRWPAVRAAHLRGHPACAACGRAAGLEVHHLEPVHLSPGRELDPANLLTLCRRCHLMVGHLDDWKSWNPAAREDAAAWLARVRTRP